MVEPLLRGFVIVHDASARVCHGAAVHFESGAVHADADAIVAPDRGDALALVGRGKPEATVVPHKVHDDANRPTLAGGPNEGALSGMIEQTTFVVVVERVDGDVLVVADFIGG